MCREGQQKGLLGLPCKLKPGRGRLCAWGIHLPRAWPDSLFLCNVQPWPATHQGLTHYGLVVRPRSEWPCGAQPCTALIQATPASKKIPPDTPISMGTLG